jgi:hypothetical protein
MRDAHLILAAVAVVRVFAGRVERFPGDASWVVDPRLLGLGVTAARLPRLGDLASCFAQARVHLVEFSLVLDLDAEMVKARLFAARGNREIDTRIALLES